jgi:hypothetical protein
VAGFSSSQKVKPKGNAIAFLYFCERLLLVYINTIQMACLRDPQNWLLQEDNGPSHETKKEGLTQKLKAPNWVPNLVHPPQSPDIGIQWREFGIS